MKQFKKNKIGEITSSQLVKIILLVVGFTILLWIFPTLLNEEEIDRETCHASVILRGTIPDITGTGSKNIVNLKCKTMKFCITDKVFGKPDCEEFKEKEKFETIRVSKDKTEEEINRFIARELASCWNMMGRGKIQIFNREITEEKRCSICSRIAFDKSLKKSLDGEVEGLGSYLLTREVPNQDVSYWDYLKQDPSNKEDKIIDDLTEGGEFGGGGATGDWEINFSTNEKAIVFFEIDKSNWEKTFISTLSALAGGFFGAKIGSPVKGAVLAYVTAEVFAPDKKITYRAGWSFSDYKGEDFEKLECKSFESIG